MSKTSDRAEVLSVAIARHFEKEPTFVKKRTEGRDALSDEGWWWCEWHRTVDRSALHALSINRPEIAMKLQGVLIDELGIESAFTEIHIALEEFAETNQLYSAHLPQAIAEAVVKAFNLEVG